MDAEQLLSQSPVIPVLVIKDIDSAVPLARALVAGGINVLEVTLRTPQGLEAIRRISEEVEGAIVGAGTVLNVNDLEQSLSAGSQFIFTPGLTPRLLDDGSQCGVPFIPGVTTPSDIMVGMESGLSVFKFFPAEAAGGVDMLKALSGPFAQAKFCPTGGINLINMSSYLQLSNVLSIGGSWITRDELIFSGAWEDITKLSGQAIELALSEKESGHD